MAGSEQRLGQMGADEAGAAGDEHTFGHGFYLEKASTARATSSCAPSASDGYKGSDTTRAHTSSATGHGAGDHDRAAGCRGIGTG